MKTLEREEVLENCKGEERMSFEHKRFNIVDTKWAIKEKRFDTYDSDTYTVDSKDLLIYIRNDLEGNGLKNALKQAIAEAVYYTVYSPINITFEEGLPIFMATWGKFVHDTAMFLLGGDDNE